LGLSPYCRIPLISTPESERKRMPPSDKPDSESELAFTGERFVPRQTDPLLALEHYHRYLLASRLALNKRILDMGCGEGYGSAFLSKRAKAVVGIDRDEVTIAHARHKYGSIPNLSFEAGSCQEIRGESNSFDMIVSFELLEHLDSDDQVRFLGNVRQLLKHDGLFIVSSPEKNEYAATYQARNEFHKHEMTLPELKSFLGACFEHVHLCAQRVLSFSTMWRLEGIRDCSLRISAAKDLFEEVQNTDSFPAPLYLIAVCSNLPLPDPVIAEINSLYLDVANSDQTKNLSRWAGQLNAEARKNRDVIRDLQQQLEERTNWALDMDAKSKEKDAFIVTLQKELNDRTKWALELDLQAQRLAVITSSKAYRLLSRLRILPR